MHSLLRSAPLTILCLASSLTAQEIYRIDSDGSIASLPRRFKIVGDIDQDGTPDYAVGDVENSTAFNYAGRAQLISGADGSLIYDWFGTAALEKLGTGIGGGGDIDGDGVLDIAICSGRDEPGAPPNAKVDVFSGADGTLIWSIESDTNDVRFGWFDSITIIDDLNSDGLDELIVGASGADIPFGGAGRVQAFSGADGSLLFTVPGWAPLMGLGFSVAVYGDHNSDGTTDLLVGTRGAIGIGCDIYCESAYVMSGADGSILLHVTGDGTSPPNQGDGFGKALAVLGDLDSDGFAEIASSAPNDDEGHHDNGKVFVFSGADGDLIGTLIGDDDSDRWGEELADAGDVDGDGTSDLLVGGRYNTANLNNSGLARVYSGANGKVLYEIMGDRLHQAGGAVAGLGDIDQDGFDDFLIGIGGVPTTGAHAGSLRVYRGGPPLVLEPVQPGVAGVLNTVRVTGANPGSSITIAAQQQFAFGLTSVPCASGEIEVYMARAKLLGPVFADPSGVAELTATVPAQFAGRSLFVQAAEFDTCRQTIRRKASFQ